MLLNTLSYTSPSTPLLFLVFIHSPNSSLENSNMRRSVQKFLGFSPGNNQEQSVGEFPNPSCNQIVKPHNASDRTDIF